MIWWSFQVVQEVNYPANVQYLTGPVWLLWKLRETVEYLMVLMHIPVADLGEGPGGGGGPGSPPYFNSRSGSATAFSRYSLPVYYFPICTFRPVQLPALFMISHFSLSCLPFFTRYIVNRFSFTHWPVHLLARPESCRVFVKNDFILSFPHMVTEQHHCR